MNYVPSREKTKTRPRGWIRLEDLPRSPKADAVTADILDRLRQHHEEDTLPRGGRGLFYDLRPHGMPRNPRGVTYTKHPKAKGKGSMEATPEYVQNQLALMRRVWNPATGERLVREGWISDARMPDPLTPTETVSARQAAENVAAYLRDLCLARQAGQPVYLELRCEAQDLMQRIARVAHPYGVHVYSGSGSDGLKPKKEAAERAAGRNVPTIVGHLADLDDDGGDIADAFAEDAYAFTEWHRDYEGAKGSFDMKRLALTRKQALAHDLLDADGHAEVDGLPVPVLDAIVRRFIEAHLDPEIARAVVQAEPRMRTEAARLAMRRIKQNGGGAGNDQSSGGADWSWAR
jgi:hypothetical protein